LTKPLGQKLKRFYNDNKMRTGAVIGLNKDNQHGSKGFTLVELMVTVVVLGLVITGIAGMYYIMQIMQVRSQHLDMATRAARTEIESLRNNGYNSLTPGTNINFTSSLPSELPKGKTGTVVISQPLPELRRLDVTVQYTDFGKQQTVTLSSNIGVIGIGQGQ
jgi:prepilin-type N-terminal cleavage/methylation domain-containing protein